MGRGKSRTQRKHFRDGRENVWKRSKSDPSNDDVNKNAVDNNTNGENNTNVHPTWQPFSTKNPAFDEYYKEQRIVSEEEWDSFVAMLRTPLPAAFRINSSSQFCDDIKSQLENDFMKSVQAEGADGFEAGGIRPLPWYPGNLAWDSNFSRMQLRKNQTLERFHEFLKLENEIGNITRQEAVSMVPPLFLDVHPDHFVLDMCAAPGSKTFQLLEIIYQSTKSGVLPNGMVIANDLDVQRCNLLIHQTKRMCTANLIVTNNEAQQFPGCRANKNVSRASEVESDPHIGQLLFDRVLCDVPCSGDGTLRKAPDLWRKWNSGMGNGLHPLQIQIAMRGLSLLKLGGRMVYSTCSMNPIENEAVVAEVLRRCGGSVELVDVSSEFPELVRRPGLRKWKVQGRGVWLTSYSSSSNSHGVLPSMFPSVRSHPVSTNNEEKIENGDEDGLQLMDDSRTSAENLDEEISDLPLERCMRIVPHDQNSGAFFIAVLCKVSPLPAIQQKPSKRQRWLHKKAELQEKLQHQTSEDNSGVQLVSEDGILEDSSELAAEVDVASDELEKAVSELNPEGTCDVNDSEEAQDPANGKDDSKKAVGKRKLQIQGRWKGVDPVIFFKDETIIKSIKEFYGIDESFPFEGHLISRNIENNHVKRIYYVSKSVKDVLELNFLVGQQLKMASVGLKMFERQTAREGSTAPCSFRISSEGLPVILAHITKQILSATPEDFTHLLQCKAIKFKDFTDAEFGEKASNLMMGCCVIVLRDSKASSDSIKVDASTIAIGCWKGKSNLSVMVTAIDCQELLERLSVRMQGAVNPSAKENINVDSVGTQNSHEIEKMEDGGPSKTTLDS